MIILGCPVIDKHDLTHQLVDSLTKTVKNPDKFMLVIVDNNSEKPYELKDFPAPFRVKIIRNETNQGYYYPLLPITLKYVKNDQDDLVGLLHNDIIFYEHGWDDRIQEAFNQTQRVGLVGLAGSYELDGGGGRGGGTMLFFRGEKGQPQSAGLRIYDLQPAVILDSLFMLFRATVVPYLKIDEHIAPCHFYDRIWSLKTIEAGWGVGVFGTEIDHMGGETSIGVAKYRDDAVAWCAKENLPLIDGSGDLTVYKEAERRFLTEYKDQKGMLPMSIDKDWNIKRF